MEKKKKANQQPKKKPNQTPTVMILMKYNSIEK